MNTIDASQYRLDLSGSDGKRETKEPSSVAVVKKNRLDREQGIDHTGEREIKK